MSSKLKFGFLLTGGCAGCETAMVDLADRLVDALDVLEVVFWAPTVADVKYKDLENMEDGSIDLSFVDGMVRLDEHEHMIKILRKKIKDTGCLWHVCCAGWHTIHGQYAYKRGNLQRGVY